MSPLSAQEQALEMSLSPVQAVYPVGSLPEFTVTFTNRSQTPVKLCRYKLDYRLKAAMVVDGGAGGPDFEAQPFVTQTWNDLKAEDIVTVGPGQTISHQLKFEADPVFGFLRRAKQPPVIPSTNAIKGFPSGTFSFNTAISNKIGLYVGQNGVFDHKLQVRHVPDQWPGIQGCFDRLVEATASVRFQ